MNRHELTERHQGGSSGLDLRLLHRLLEPGDPDGSRPLVFSVGLGPGFLLQHPPLDEHCDVSQAEAVDGCSNGGPPLPNA